MPYHTLQIALILAVIFFSAPWAQAAVAYVANHGVDGASCGAKDTPCRSISQGLFVAGIDDTVVVGPGIYGDLDGDGVPGETGEETQAPGCGCMLAINKPVSLVSSHGAAATIIDARTLDVLKNVLIIADGTEFGKPGKGFTVTNSGTVGGGSGIVIDSGDVAIRGNHVIAIDGSGGYGIQTVSFPQTMTIEANLVQGWSLGVFGAGKTVRRNQVSFGGIVAGDGGEINGNVVTDSTGGGIQLRGAAHAVGNAVSGSRYSGFVVVSPFSGTIEKNNIVGNGRGPGAGSSLNCGVENVDVAGLTIGQNYWGSASGPGSNPADAVCTQASGTTLPVTSFATKPFNVKAKIKP